ncbi:hypothetical protein [Nostoc sp. C110]|uniref:hypothetical protein n=1 Tax=Nostoc sp. C110 TaxID=3349876 RepID=UPI00370D2649
MSTTGYAYALQKTSKTKRSLCVDIQFSIAAQISSRMSRELDSRIYSGVLPTANFFRINSTVMHILTITGFQIIVL